MTDAPLVICTPCGQLWDYHDPLEQIVCSVRELTEPTTIRTPAYHRVEVCRVASRDVELIQLVGYTREQAFPSLLDRLRGAAGVAGASDDAEPGSWGKPGSRPPGGFEALATLIRLETHIAQSADRDRITPEAGLALIRHQVTTDPRLAHRLRHDTRRWRNWAATAAGWDRVFRPLATCPACGRLGTLRVHSDHSAVCGGEDGCLEAWGPDTLGILAEHIRSETDIPRPRPALTDTQFLDRGLCPRCVRRLSATTRAVRRCDGCLTDYPINDARIPA